MNTIGFIAGGDLYELGSRSDVELFFEAIRNFAVPKRPEQQWDLITDRLYKRYLAKEDLSRAQGLMDCAETLLEQEPSVNLTSLPSAMFATVARNDAGTLADVFHKFFDRFRRAVESAQSFDTRWGEYIPLKIGHTDVPNFILDRDRPTEQYDKLTGQPFWI